MIKIQKPIKEDSRGVQEVFYKTWLETYPNKEAGILKEDIEEHFKNRFSDEVIKKKEKFFMNIPKNELFLVAKDGEKVVGVCAAVIGEDFNQLRGIYVLPDYQRQVIGLLFWNKIKEFLDKDKNIIVQLVAYNKQAESFYKKLGFVDTGKRFVDETHKMSVSGKFIPEMEMIIKC
ncbi:MAG: GNAT family N-acetyltransferase [bacterium]